MFCILQLTVSLYTIGQKYLKGVHVLKDACFVYNNLQSAYIQSIKNISEVEYVYVDWLNLIQPLDMI